MSRTPVIFVPGLTGSFNLSVLLDWRAPTLSGWSFPPFVNYGAAFLKAFQQAGYTRDRDLFVAFYDWRKAVHDSAEQYLIPWITRAKERSGATKVILVAHSMGGLVSRSYIQSERYRDDVERLITLGTPHRGSADAYKPWGGGVLQSEPMVQAVFNVYLWYLRHAHPFQTELDPLKTMRSQVPGLRDLLPVDNYLITAGGPPIAKDEDQMVERNLWGDLLNRPTALEMLFGRVPVTTVAGVGFRTIAGYIVGPPLLPPESPPRFPDGVPQEEQHSGDGDGTVLLNNARLGHPAVANLAPLNIAHGQLPDQSAVIEQVFAQLGMVAPALDAAPSTESKLVVLSASPVLLTVETPAGPPMLAPEVLGAAPAGVRRRRRVRARDYGHRGKHLNMVVIDNPPAGDYSLRVVGDATGDFAIGAFLIGPAGTTVLGAAEDQVAAVEPGATAINTAHGHVATASELYYRISCIAPDQAPDVHFDAELTAARTAERLQEALGGEGAVLGAAPDDPAAMAGMAEQLLGARDPVLAAALLEQIRALRER